MVYHNIFYGIIIGNLVNNYEKFGCSLALVMVNYQWQYPCQGRVGCQKQIRYGGSQRRLFLRISLHVIG